MSGSQDSRDLSRRAFAGGLAVVSGTGTLLGQEAAASKRRGPQNANATPQNTSRPKQGMPDEVPPFGEAIIFRRKEIAPKIREFGNEGGEAAARKFQGCPGSKSALPAAFRFGPAAAQLQSECRAMSSAQPLGGGWEKPDCELRGHFVGHYLSACALMYSLTGDDEIKSKGAYITRELARAMAIGWM